MKTPYDTAMRVRRREMDDMRLSISVQLNQLVSIESSKAAVDETLTRESRLATGDHGLASHAYIERMRAQRAQLARNKADADEQLSQLRARAVAVYGGFKAIETASDTYREDAARSVAQAEQGLIDDLAAAAFIRRHRGRTT